MSDRKKHHNTDNKNTSTIYIPNDERVRYNEQRQAAQQRRTSQPSQRSQPQQYQTPPQYQGQPQQYQTPPQYQGQPQQYQTPPQYQGQPQQYQTPPQYQGQPQQYQTPPQYQGNPQQYQTPPQYQSQPQQYQGSPNIMAQPYQDQRYGQSPYQGQPQYRQTPPPQYRQAPPPQYRSQPPKKRPPQQRRKKKSSNAASKFLFRLIWILVIIFLLIFGVYSCTSITLIKKMNFVEPGSRSHTSGALDAGYVRSILLIGTDGRSLDERGRSDTMILMSINSSTDKISLTSFMRDCYVEVPGYGWDKLNASYSYGGAELLMDTIEHNFGVRVDDYVCVNFISFANIVDSIGGIDIDVSDAEAQEINTILQAEVNSIMGDDVFSDLLSSGGKLHLSGKQALSYARIRYVGNSDFERTERQRRVIELAMDKVKKMNPITMKNLSQTVLPDVVTNMSVPDLYLLSLRAPFLLKYERQQMQIPVEGSFYGASTDSGDALIVDFDQNYNAIKDKVFSKS